MRLPLVFALVAATLGVAACNAPAVQTAPPLEVLDVVLDYRSVTTVEIPGQYFVSIEVSVANGSPESVPLGFETFSVISEAGVSYPGSPASEFEPAGCLIGTEVVSGRTASCRALFSLRDGDLPTALVYRGFSSDRETPLQLCSDDAPDLCGYTCVDFASDRAHCGGCGRAVTDGECVDGEVVCPEPESRCGDACVDLSTSAAHCGACDTPVADGLVCSAGEAACPEGLTDCDGSCVNLSNDPANCGACGRAVPAGEACANGETFCTGGAESCADVCVDTEIDPDHCGGCDQACPVPDGLDPTRGCSATNQPLCFIQFPTPGGRCINVCNSIGWQCDDYATDCGCMSEELAGACECSCSLG